MTLYSYGYQLCETHTEQLAKTPIEIKNLYINYNGSERFFGINYFWVAMYTADLLYTLEVSNNRVFQVCQVNFQFKNIYTLANSFNFLIGVFTLWDTPLEIIVIFSATTSNTLLQCQLRFPRRLIGSRCQSNYACVGRGTLINNVELLCNGWCSFQPFSVIWKLPVYRRVRWKFG